MTYNFQKNPAYKNLNTSSMNDQPMNDQPMNDQPMNDQPMNDQPMNDQPMNESDNFDSLLNEVISLFNSVFHISDDFTSENKHANHDKQKP